MPKGVYTHKSKPVVSRFMAKVVKSESGCWLWQGGHYTNGYAAFAMPKAGGGWGNRLAHRVSYELFRGPIPNDLVIDHLCRVRDCVNPEHLEVVTFRENLLRGEGLTAKWAHRTHCEYGHPLSGDNLAIRRGWRECVTCRREQTAKGWVRYWERRAST